MRRGERGEMGPIAGGRQFGKRGSVNAVRLDESDESREEENVGSGMRGD